MVQYHDLRYSEILKEDVPQQRSLVKNQSSATGLGWKGIIKNVRLKISQQNTSLAMTQVPGSQQFWKIWVISCDLINKSDNSSGFISGFFGYPGLPLGRPDPAQTPWPPTRPSPTRSKPGPNCEACFKVVNSGLLSLSEKGIFIAEEQWVGKAGAVLYFAVSQAIKVSSIFSPD